MGTNARCETGPGLFEEKLGGEEGISEGERYEGSQRYLIGWGLAHERTSGPCDFFGFYFEWHWEVTGGF